MTTKTIEFSREDESRLQSLLGDRCIFFYKSLNEREKREYLRRLLSQFPLTIEGGGRADPQAYYEQACRLIRSLMDLASILRIQIEEKNGGVGRGARITSEGSDSSRR